jgi:hypothetical protein
MYEPETLTRFRRQAAAMVQDPNMDAESLGQLRTIRQAWDVALTAAVVRLHREGLSWADIGRGLQMSRQQAHRMFAHHVALAQAEKLPELVAASRAKL